MVEVLPGTGGWSYFRVPGYDSLSAYSQAFSFAEVNASYYRLPSMNVMRRWRQKVPESFGFSLRCPRELVDAYGLELKERARQLFLKVEQACKIIQAPILTVLISDKAKIKEEELENRLEEFIRTFHADDTKVAVEFRRRVPSNRLMEVMKQDGALHTVDLSKEEPEYEAPLLYSRLFGKGEQNIYEFDDTELQEIASRAKKAKIQKSILAFHGVRMYRDAARIKTYLESGYFPRITNNVGVEAVREVLREDAQFPTTKTELLERQGWKLFSPNTSGTKRLRDVLTFIPDRNYHNITEVLESLRKHAGLS